MFIFTQRRNLPESITTIKKYLKETIFFKQKIVYFYPEEKKTLLKREFWFLRLLLKIKQ